jgi:glucose-6-phosphate 1-dehydrogenase
VEFKTPHERRHDNLVFRIQPGEGISLDLVVKEPGFDDRMQHAAMDFRYHEAFKDREHIDAYERVLMDAVRGDQSLFASDREVLATWRVLEPVLETWSKDGQGLHAYEPGSAGPGVTL